ncbi:MAG: T9SS type A sorting domain-containing protein, partial [Polaribacter sp.]|nr:T9SS type A sorting domain-containing protein [Polaribacter sp.]
SLVVWRTNGEIILPKRYHTFKHFTNLVKKGYKVIKTENAHDDVMVGAFISPNEDKIVLQVFNEGASQDFTLQIPKGTIAIKHYITSDDSSQNFTLQNDVSFTTDNEFTSVNVDALSLHTFVYEIDKTQLKIDENKIDKKVITLFPNPTNNSFSLHFPKIENYRISLYQIDGKQVLKTKSIQNLKQTIDVSSLSSGIYFIKIYTRNKNEFTTLKFLKQ